MFARTQRLLLRPGWAEDAPALFDAIADEHVVRNLASAPWPYRLEDAIAFLAVERKPHEPCMLIFSRTDSAPELAGSIGFGRRPDGELEFGCWIARKFWSCGYATEASQAMIDIARTALRLPKLGASYFVDNPASGRVLEKLGFRPTGSTVPRYSAGRDATVPCRLLELDLTASANEKADTGSEFRMMAA